MNTFRQLAAGLVLAASMSAFPALACPGHGHGHGQGHAQKTGYSVSLENCVKVYRGKSTGLNYKAIFKMEQIRLGEQKLKAQRAHMQRLEAEAARQTALISALASRTSPVYSGSAQRKYYSGGGYYGRALDRPGYRPKNRPHHRNPNRPSHSSSSAGGGNHSISPAPVLAGGHSGHKGKGGGKKGHH